MMLSVLCCALQISVATPRLLADTLVVLVGDRRRTVPLVAHPDGGRAVRADLFARAIEGTLIADESGRFHLQIADTRVNLEVGSLVARVGPDTLVLATAPYRKGGVTLLPLALIQDVLPRTVTGVLYDDGRRELRRFGAVSARKPLAAPVALTPGAPTPVAPLRPSAANARQHVVVVDAGHGGIDKGMSGPLGASPKVHEKTITLGVARALQAALQRRGITVVMTRESDTLIALHDRARIGNAANGDLFMSIHVNAANPRWKDPGGARGFETYFLSEARTDDARRVEALENEAVKFETGSDSSRDDPLAFIIRDMAQNEHLRESSRLADLVQAGLRKVHPGPSRGVKQAGFSVLVRAFMPAVLVEVGFGSSRPESAYMSDTRSQRAMAEALADAVVRFLTEYERKGASGS